MCLLQFSFMNLYCVRFLWNNLLVLHLSAISPRSYISNNYIIHCIIPKPILFSILLTFFSIAQIVQGLNIDAFSRGKMDDTAKELLEEKTTAFEFIHSDWIQARL